jgi:hypothetical protein
MTGKNKCKWCGAEGSKHAVSYSCGSWHTSNGLWSQGIACRDLCEQLRLQHEQTIEILRKRIDAALKVLNRISEFGDWVQWDDVADVVEILTGNSPTNLEGSE